MQNVTLSMTLSVVPTKNPIAVNMPNVEAINAAPAIEPKNVPAMYANSSAITRPVTANIRRIGFSTLRAIRTIRIGAVKNAATIFIGCEATFLKIIPSLLFSWDKPVDMAEIA